MRTATGGINGISKRRDLKRLLVAVMVVGMSSGTQAIAAVSFQGLGDLPGGAIFSGAATVSADGLVVAGSSQSSSGLEAFRWTLTEGLQGLGDLPGGEFNSGATGVSADGSVIVGFGRSDSGSEAFRWVEGTGMAGLGDLPGRQFASDASGVSADGSVVVGTGTPDNGTTGAFVWTVADDMVGIGSLPGPFFESTAYGISADGLTVVGRSISSSGGVLAYRWTNGGGMIPLDASVDIDSAANAASNDGSVIIGWMRNTRTSTREAFRWTVTDGMVGLGFANAVDVSEDGSTIVGLTFANQGFQAVIWDDIAGPRFLQDVLTGLGLDLTGWTLESATGISDDGLTIVGTGINPDGNTEAFIARLPEPGAGVVLLAGLILMGGSRKR